MSQNKVDSITTQSIKLNNYIPPCKTLDLMMFPKLKDWRVLLLVALVKTCNVRKCDKIITYSQLVPNLYAISKDAKGGSTLEFLINYIYEPVSINFSTRHVTRGEDDTILRNYVMS